MPKERQKRTVYPDALNGELILNALVTFTTLAANEGCANTREQFDAILCAEHNDAAPDHKQITATYLEENSLRVSQKFGAHKTKMKALNTPIHLGLPRRARGVSKATVDRLKKHPNWEQFQKINAAAGRAKKAKK